MMKISLPARMVAPYLAVGLFWCIFSHGWLAILAYHAQVLLWLPASLPVSFRPLRRRILIFSLLAAGAGPLMYFLLPHMTLTDLPTWLAAHRLSGLSLLVMIG